MRLIYLAANGRAAFDPIGHIAHVYDEIPNLAIEVALIDPPEIKETFSRLQELSSVFNLPSFSIPTLDVKVSVNQGNAFEV
jgi:hypothetical protein